MSFLEQLLGAGTQRDDYQDFVNRYQQGHPSEGYSDDEVRQRYHQVTSNLSPDEYEQAAADAFARLSPQERQAFAEYLSERGVGPGRRMPGSGNGRVDDYGDPHALARAARQAQEQQPGMLEQLLGGNQGGQGMSGNDALKLLNNPLAKAAMAGIAAMAAQRFLNGRRTN